MICMAWSMSFSHLSKALWVTPVILDVAAYPSQLMTAR
jgi:hypothetical protein